MNRRSFLGTMIGGIAASAAVQTWPFRVYSFPSSIIPTTLPAMSIRFIKALDIDNKIISRFDVLYGFGQNLTIPKYADAGYSITAQNRLGLSGEELHSFATRYSAGKFPVRLISTTVPNEGGWVQRGWDVHG